jgi:hypothetical protein
MTERARGPDRAASELLPDELLWAEGGHASDVVLTALADGQLEIVPASARAHVEGCMPCTAHLGNAALLSLHATREISALAQHEAAAQRAPLPRLAIGLGLLVAALGLVPSLVDASPDALDLRTLVTHDAPVLLVALQTLGRRAFEPGSTASLAVTYGVAALLLAMAFTVVRLLPKKETSS